MEWGQAAGSCQLDRYIRVMQSISERAKRVSHGSGAGRRAPASDRVGGSGAKPPVKLEALKLAYIITEPCIGTKDTACVDVCPVDCIHPRKDEPEFATTEMLYIHPDECIDCGACVPACPVEAIFALDETPDKWQNFIETNAQYTRSDEAVSEHQGVGPRPRSSAPRPFFGPYP